MIFAIVFAQLWGVIELFVLTSLSRTLRLRTVIAAMAVGLYAIAPVAVILQKAWIGVAASLVGKSMAEMTGIASYTVDPFIEEALKLLPLALLMLIPAIRRQWTLTDCLLIGGALGSGFGLAEHLYRYASSPDAAEAVRGGWMMTFGRYTPMVPGIPSSLTSWLPNGVWFPEDPTRVNWHLAWSAIGGLALGLAVRNPKRSARLTAGGLFLLIGLDHAAGNTHDIANTWLAFLAAPLDLITSHLGVLAFVAVIAAWWLDRRAQPEGDALEPLLAAERSASPRIIGTFTAAFKRLPWSIPWVFGFDRGRRAYHAARVTAPESVGGMLAALVAERDRVDRKLTQPEAPPLIPPSWNPTALRALLRKRPVIISLVLLAPSILYLIIGGFPQTAWVQAVVTSGVVWPLVILITLVAQARLVMRVARNTRNLGQTARLPIGDDAAILGLQLACGIGSVALGGFTLMRVFSGVSVGSTLLSHAHASDAANRLTPGSGVSVSNSGGAFDSHPDSEHSSSDSSSDSNSDSSSDSNPDSSSDSQPSAPSTGSPSDYSPLPPPSPPPPSDPSDFQPAGQNPSAADPSDYSPLPPPSPPPPSADGPDVTPDNEDGVGTRVDDSSSDSSDDLDGDLHREMEHSDSRVGSDGSEPGAEHHMIEPNDSPGPAADPMESTDHPTLEHGDSHPEPGSDSSSDSNDDYGDNSRLDPVHSDSRVGSDAPDPGAEHHMVEPNEPTGPAPDPPESTDHPTLEHGDSHPEPDYGDGRPEHPTSEHLDTHADTPDKEPDGPTIEPVKPVAGPNASSDGTPDNEDGVGTRVPDDEDGFGTRHPDTNPAPSRPQPSAQEQADRAADDAADAAAKADADAQAARQRLVDAHNAEDSNDIRRATSDPGSDPDVAAARQRTHDAQTSAEDADRKALDGDDPWNADQPNKTAADDARREAEAAKNAQDQTEYDYSQRQKAADDAAAAADKAASDQAQDALNAANAKAAAAHDASSQAASAAGHAANVDSAASDYAAAKAKADAAWSGSDTEAYSEAQKAALAAKQRLDEAQAAADAARDKPEGVATWRHKKP